ncbi:MAG: hemolysin III family protein [Proteobacteria bacterium]|nr:hemolysin III family protein [Pseudomonadota bacterium]
MTETKRPPTPRELVADGVVHALGVGLGLPAAIVLVAWTAFRHGHQLAPIAIYAAGLCAMFVCSAAYNVLRRSRLRGWLRRFDHAAIFAMIGGTYTPFTVLRLESVWSAVLTGVIWSVAGLGIVAKLLQPRWIEPVSVGLYLALGWIGVVAIGPFLDGLATTTLALLAAGGVVYTAGVAFFLWQRLPYHNAIWHAFVLVAAGLHYGAVVTMV